MKTLLIPLAALALAAGSAWAKAPADATGECKDGTYTTSAEKAGACSGHGGVKKWLAKTDKAEKADKSATKAATKAAPEKASKPSDATGECKDGTYTTAATKSGACAGHKGVKTWYGAGKADAAPSKGATTTSSRAPASAPAKEATPPSSRTSATTTPPSERTAARGGGAGKVWVNTDSKVYHCEKDALYGKTKQGDYMTEAQAKAAGARPARGKECS